MTNSDPRLSAGSEGLTNIERVRLALAMADAGYEWDVELEYVEALLKAYDDLRDAAQTAPDISSFLNAVYDAIGDLETDKDGNVRWSALVNIQRGIGQKAHDLAAQPPAAPVETKTVYIKRWRTLVNLPAKYADEIVEALRPHECSSAETDGQSWPQPIATAPKDGGEFIAHQNGDVYKCCWHTEDPDEGPGRSGWWDFSNQSFEDPTEWSPLRYSAPSFAASVREALEIAEDVLSRQPYSSSIWPNGMHPQTGIEKIRGAIAGLSLNEPQTASSMKPNGCDPCDYPYCGCWKSPKQNGPWLQTVTIVLPSGYKTAEELAKDCGFQIVYPDELQGASK